MSRSICFYQRGIPCNGFTPQIKPLGGTESAMIYMARALAARGNAVSVFCETDAPGTYDGVAYRHWRGFEAFARKNPFDVFISVRGLIPLLAGRWGKLQIYFSPDAHDQPFVNQAFSLKFNHEGTVYEVGFYPLTHAHHFADAVFCVGEWQAETFSSKFKIPREKIYVAHNGVVLSDFNPKPLSEREKRLVYSSTPFRGLEYLLRAFPKIKKRVPDAKCAVMSGMQVYGMSADEDKRSYQSIYQLANQSGVQLLGPLPKKEMGEILTSSRVLAYPNTFAETFCIAALEAQASGLPIVSSQLAAMKERVEEGVDGYLIAGHPAIQAYEDEFVEKAVKLLTDDAEWERMSRMALQKARTYSYEALAEAWEEKLSALEAGAKPAPARFIPKEIECGILVKGYPKKIHLSQKAMTDTFCRVLKEAGFERAALDVAELAPANESSHLPENGLRY